MADTREAVKRRLAEGSPLSAWPDIDPMRPAEKTTIAFVGRTPKAPNDHDLWHRCSFCQHDRKFQEGTIVLCEDHRLRLIGDRCWKNHIESGDYEDAKHDWMNFQSRDAFQRALPLLVAELTSVEDQLFGLLRTQAETLGEAGALPVETANVLEPIGRFLREAKREGGRLFVPRLKPPGQRQPGEGAFYREFVHQLAGLGVTSGLRVPYETRLKNALKASRDALDGLKGTAWDEVTLRTFKSRRKPVMENIAAAVQAVETSAANLAEAKAFYSPANLAGLAKWAEDSDCELAYGSTRLETGHRRIRVVEGRLARSAEISAEVLSLRLPQVERLAELARDAKGLSD